MDHETFITDEAVADRQYRTLQDLTIRDNFMFGAVMQDPEICKELLEIILELPIDHVEVITEKELRFQPQAHGVRLDVFAKDEYNTKYNVEMQLRPDSIERRSRYYHSQMDADMLLSGTEYEKLPNAYVIFICDYDPFGEGRYRYRVNRSCLELPDYPYDDGSHTIFLSTRGTNRQEVPTQLANFLDYVRKSAPTVDYPSQDPFIDRIEEKIHHIKKRRDVEERFMLLEDMLRKERKYGLEIGREKGREEGRKEERDKMEKKMVNLISSMLDAGIGTPERIAAIIDVPLDQVLKIKEEMKI